MFVRLMPARADWREVGQARVRSSNSEATVEREVRDGVICCAARSR